MNGFCLFYLFEIFLDHLAMEVCKMTHKTIWTLKNAADKIPNNKSMPTMTKMLYSKRKCKTENFRNPGSMWVDTLWALLKSASKFIIMNWCILADNHDLLEIFWKFKLLLKTCIMLFYLLPLATNYYPCSYKNNWLDIHQSTKHKPCIVFVTWEDGTNIYCLKKHLLTFPNSVISSWSGIATPRNSGNFSSLDISGSISWRGLPTV